jgi:serine/threonine protein kinase
MLDHGSTHKTTSGRKVRVGDFLRAGGQGEAYRAQLCNTGEDGVLKIFRDEFNTPQTRRRLDYLIGLKLPSLSAAIQAPTEIIAGKYLGHYAPFATGASLDQELQRSPMGLIPAIQLGLALSHAISVMHGLRLAHGDLHSENLLVEKTAGEVYRLRIIDLDNFSAPGIPPPNMLGQSLYMAPKQRRALTSGIPSVPDIYSDRFSLGVLMHEILLLKHPAAGFDGDAASFEKTMCRGQWCHDPAMRDLSSPDVGGYPSEILDSDLTRLFRRAFSLQEDERPTAEEWKQSLLWAMNHSYACPHCGGQFICSSSRTRCLYCSKSFPTLTIMPFSGGVEFPILSAALDVGRSFLNDDTVSVHHAIFRKLGPDTYIESVGRNGTYRNSGGVWIRIPDHHLFQIKKGDQLRLGNCIVNIGSVS